MAWLQRFKQLTRRRVPRRCSAHVAAIVLSPAWLPVTRTHRFFYAQVKLPLYVPTGCLDVLQTLFAEQLFPQDPRSLRSLLGTGARGGARCGRGLGLTHGHFYCPVSTSLPTVSLACSQERTAPSNPVPSPPLHPCRPRPQDLCSPPPPPPRLTLKASTCLPAFIRPT